MPSSSKAPTDLECDILVAGGGAAGVPCALAAARSGAKVILVQDRPVLGGNASSEIRMHIVGANGTGKFDRGRELVTEARETGIIEEIRLENCVRNPQRSASVFDLILYDLCRSEPNLTLMLNTTVCGATSGPDKAITSVSAERPSTEDSFRIMAKTYIDCTGDGRLGMEAGAPFMEGREDQEAFGESLGLEQADKKRLGSTILLTARKHGRPMPFQAPEWAREFTKEDLKLRLYANPGEEEFSHEYGYWWAEWGGELDTIRNNEEIREELLAIALGIWNHVKNAEGDPFDASHWALDWIGFVPGKRESRRFIGQHVLSETDLMTSRPFPDAIAYGGWSIDLHPPEGVDAPDLEPCIQHPVPHLFDIPLRSCVSRDIPNLMFAGRNHSATHVAFASTRVMATCAAMGQGVGTAAALGIAENILPCDLADQSGKIQDALLKDDAFLIGQTETGKCPIAARAFISASSEKENGEAVNVISGQTRTAGGEWGAPLEREVPGSHRWISSSLPAWIQFEWDEAVSLTGIQLVFDTGLHRHLTLSHHDGYTDSKMIWGKPQPETVKAYRIEWQDDLGQWRLLGEEKDNYQRLRRHRFSDTETVEKLRVLVTETNGIEEARICGVRFF